MPQGQKQQRNPELVRNLTTDFLTNERFFLDGARLLSATLATHAAGGGQLTYSWLADSSQNYGIGAATAWTQLNVTPADYFATAYGGPYVDLNGLSEALYIPDAMWQEAVTEELFIWHWCNPANFAATISIASKYDTNGNNCSWRLIYDNATGNFQFVVNGTGNPVNDVAVGVTYTETASVWYFVAGYFESATQIRAWVGKATDSALSSNSVVVGIPASVSNGTAPLAIGTSFNNAPILLNGWSGYIGIGSMRFNVPATDIDAYASRLFAMTQQLYQ